MFTLESNQPQATKMAVPRILAVRKLGGLVVVGALRLLHGENLPKG